jgi:aspartyl-tRNA(Asn)/glutamyl-tRNA(Gln) amidotransferase subunit B
MISGALHSAASSIPSWGAHLIRGKQGGLWEVCIGLEVHAQINSLSKLFSRASASPNLDATSNSQVAYLDAAIPGTLPLLNEECVNKIILTSLALNATVHPHSVFERKHYFYCDLPLGYQITQQRHPLASNGLLEIEVGATPEHHSYRKTVRITRIQLEQDSGNAFKEHPLSPFPSLSGWIGKSVHDVIAHHSLIDLNRAGVPLMEIVFEPDLRSSQEAAQTLRQLQHLLRHVGTSDANMEEGGMRADLNVSVRRVVEGEEGPISSPLPPMGPRVEIKNMNSVRFLARAVEYETRRQVRRKQMLYE